MRSRGPPVYLCSQRDPEKRWRRSCSRLCRRDGVPRWVRDRDREGAQTAAAMMGGARCGRCLRSRSRSSSRWSPPRVSIPLQDFSSARGGHRSYVLRPSQRTTTLVDEADITSPHLPSQLTYLSLLRFLGIATPRIIVLTIRSVSFTRSPRANFLTIPPPSSIRKFLPVQSEQRADCSPLSVAGVPLLRQITVQGPIALPQAA